MAKYDQICEDAYELAKKRTVTHNRAWIDSPWHNFFENKNPMYLPNTGVENDVLEHIGRFPWGFYWNVIVYNIIFHLIRYFRPGAKPG